MYRSLVPALSLALCTIPFASNAATFTPTSFADAPDAILDGVCASTLAGSPCTLRAAIMEANATPAADTIQLNGGVYTLSIAGTNENGGATGDLDVTQTLTIQSITPGVLTTIDGGAVDRVLHVSGLSNFTLSGVIVRNGRANSAGSSDGGGILLTNSGDNLIVFSVIEDNLANAGGGLFMAGTGNRTLLQLSVLRKNQTDATLGFTNPEGDAARVTNDAQLRLEEVSVHGNASQGSGSGERGSISVSGSSLTAFSSSIDGANTKGISAYNSDVTLNNVTITDNGDFGLRWGRFSGVGVSLFMRNSIVAGNGVDCLLSDPDGGAVDIDGHNIDSDGSCGLSSEPMDGNQSGIALDWILGPLNTQIALPARFPHSPGPAVDAGSPLDTTMGLPDACFRYDQRGVDRSTNGPCDVGAVEAIHLFGNGFEGVII